MDWQSSHEKLSREILANYYNYYNSYTYNL